MLRSSSAGAQRREAVGCESRQEADEVINLGFSQVQRLHLRIDERIPFSTFVEELNDVPERLEASVDGLPGGVNDFNVSAEKNGTGGRAAGVGGCAEAQPMAVKESARSGKTAQFSLQNACNWHRSKQWFGEM
jgi:hypothetical protein